MDAPKQTQKEAVDDRAEPGLAGGWFAGNDAVPILRRAGWGALCLGGAVVVLLGIVAYELHGLAGLFRQGIDLLRDAIRILGK